MAAYAGLLTALGWSLLDSIWQMAVLWTAYFLLTAGNKRISAAGKYNLVLLFVVFSAEWFVYTLIHLLRQPSAPVIPGFIPVSSTAGRCIPYLSGLYLVILSLRLVQYGFQSAKRHHSRFSLDPVSPKLRSFTEKYIRIMGITKKVSVYQSEKSETAETSGFLKPMILLPLSLITQLTAEQVEAILVHELYHIRRNDYLIHICMTCFRSIFFFNPFAHLFHNALERERELACDDGVLELGYEPRVYAEALFSLEKFRQISPGFTLAADGNKPWLLMERIRRVLGEPAQKEKRFSPLVLSGLTAAFVFFGLQLISIPESSAGNRVVPVHFEVSEEKNMNPVTENAYRSLVIVRNSPRKKWHSTDEKKLVKKPQNFFHSPVPPAIEPGEMTAAYFVDENQDRNYTNESAAGLVTETVPVYKTTPYVPSASLSYELQLVNTPDDSVRDQQNEKCIQDVINASRLNAVIKLKKVQTEMEQNKRQLVEIELKNKNLILLDQHNTLPVLKKMHREIKVKKNELKELLNQLQVSQEEIIHI
jgi:Zn-dependent protease with chaperone function